MTAFWHGHATHPDWRVGLGLAAAQIDAQRDARRAVRAAADTGTRRDAPGPDPAAPTLGWVYFTDAYAADAEALLGALQARWPGVAWVGASGVGIAAGGVEYFEEPALSLMLASLPRERFRVFSGARPLGDFAAHTAQVHADPGTADLAELVADMSRRTATGYLFGGLASAATRSLHLADGVLQGGISGVAFAAGVGLVSRITQGCQPIGPQRTVTAAERNVVIALDGEPALDCLMRDLRLEGTPPRAALQRLRQTLVGLSDAEAGATADPGSGADATTVGTGPTGTGAAPAARVFSSPARRGAFGSDTRVRHLVGLDPGRRGIAIADHAERGQKIAFCGRDLDAARRDLMRICAEIREELEPETLPLETALARRSNAGAPDAAPPTAGIHGAVYVSCSGRGGPHFGAPSAELAIVRHALGDVPLVGFFAAGEIAREHLYGYTGVLTVFTDAHEVETT